MVQQLMREGNILSRLRKASPMGLIARTTWRFCRTRSINRLYMARGVDSIFLPYTSKGSGRGRDDRGTGAYTVCSRVTYTLTHTAYTVYIHMQYYYTVQAKHSNTYCMYTQLHSIITPTVCMYVHIYVQWNLSKMVTVLGSHLSKTASLLGPK